MSYTVSDCKIFLNQNLTIAIQSIQSPNSFFILHSLCDENGTDRARNVSYCAVMKSTYLACQNKKIPSPRNLLATVRPQFIPSNEQEQKNEEE
jgi:hypothetical protein